MVVWDGKLKKKAAFAGLVVVLAAGCATNGTHPVKRPTDSEPGKSVAAPEPNAKTLYAMARMMRAQGKLDEQEAVLRRIVAEEPKFLPAYADLAEIRIHQKRPADAAQELARGLEVSPQDPVLLNDLGVCALLEDKPEEALQHFEAAVKAAPREPRYSANVALALGLLGRYDESLTAYRQVLSEADAQYNMRIIEQMRKDAPADAPGAVTAEDLKLPSAPAPTEAEPVPVPETP